MLTRDDDLTSALGHLGFSQYEARAYSALVGADPMNGHEVSKISQIPPSKIYETLSRLVEKGAVFVQQSEPTTYSACPWETVKAAAQTKFERAIASAQSGFANRPPANNGGEIWTLKETDTVLATARKAISGALTSIFASVWDQELEILGPALEEASRRGCTVHVAIYGTTKLDGPHGYDLTLCGVSVLERMKGRRLTVIVSDHCECLIAEFKAHGGVNAVTTSSPMIGLLAAEYIKSDVLGRLLIDEIGDDRFEHIRHTPGLIDALLRS